LIVTRKHPINLNTNDLSLFSHEFQLTINTPVISVRRFIFYDESLYSPFKKNIFSLQLRGIFNILFKIISSKIYLKQNLIVITDQWSYGYFHWMLDCLPKLIFYLSNYDKCYVVLPFHLKSFSFVSQSLDLIPNVSYSFVNQGKFNFFATIHHIKKFPFTGNYVPSIVQDLREKIISNYTKVPYLKIYISRRLAAKRKIQNELDVIEHLKKLGFLILDCENISFKDHKLIFSQCSILIANHGAGLSNMIFMNSCTKVLELRRNLDAHNNCYFSLASALSLDYYYLNCQSAHYFFEENHNADIIVPMNSFKDLLKFL
jgi:hypothetical protein